MRQCRLLTSFQEGPQQCSFKEKSSFFLQVAKMANWITVVSCYHWQTLRNSFFFFLRILGEPEKKKKRQVSEDEWCARLDKRMARARHELARIVMGTIFLV